MEYSDKNIQYFCRYIPTHNILLLIENIRHDRKPVYASVFENRQVAGSRLAAYRTGADKRIKVRE